MVHEKCTVKSLRAAELELHCPAAAAFFFFKDDVTFIS